MGNALLRRKILVTRPRGQSEKICSMIEDAGGIAIPFPLQEIVPVTETPALRDKLTRLSHYQMAIFISVNAVHHAFKLLPDAGSVFDRITVLAAGNATAAALQGAGITHVISTGKTGGSETLLQLPQLQASQIHGKRVIIFRGAGGREHLFTELKTRGAEPDYAEIYQRLPVQYESTTLDHLWTVQRPDVIVVSSNEGLQVLADMQTPEHRVIMQNTDLIVISQRAAELAQALGFNKTPYLAGDTSDAGLLDALHCWAEQHDRTHNL